MLSHVLPQKNILIESPYLFHSMSSRSNVFCHIIMTHESNSGYDIFHPTRWNANSITYSYVSCQKSAAVEEELRAYSAKAEIMQNNKVILLGVEPWFVGQQHLSSVIKWQLKSFFHHESVLGSTHMSVGEKLTL